jgi:formate/nitrite transporter FocA (FNT family)
MSETAYDTACVADVDDPHAPAAPVFPMALDWLLVPVTLGNIIGGAVLVGIVYWFVYLRPRRSAPR